MSVGSVSIAQRKEIFGNTSSVGIAAAGTTAATATVLPAANCMVTSATGGSADGVILQAGTELGQRTVANNTSTTIMVYPPTGCQFNGAAANLPIALPANSAMLAIFLTSTNITAVTS